MYIGSQFSYTIFVSKFWAISWGYFKVFYIKIKLEASSLEWCNFSFSIIYLRGDMIISIEVCCSVRNVAVLVDLPCLLSCCGRSTKDTQTCYGSNESSSFRL